MLEAWAATPARFREDANAEEDAAVGGYRDRLVVELAQNAADAAARAGVEGRLLLRLLDTGGPSGALLAANTGAPLDAAGVQGLATLRASDKRTGDAVGRFGVGFTAVLAVADEAVIASATGAVRFAAEATRAAVRDSGSVALQAELDARNGHVPVLRLPFTLPAATQEVPDGYDTVVLLPLRDAAARELVETLLAAADDVLLLALPQLAVIRVEQPGHAPRELGDVEERWHLLRRSGRHAPELLADRGSEERRRLGWQLTWALPRGGQQQPAGVICAPTPTDDPLPWPATLLLTAPLGPDRRRIADGPATTALLGEAATAYVELLVGLAGEGWTGPDGQEACDLLPDGVPADRRDAELRDLVLDAAAHAPLLRAVETIDGLPMQLRPADAVALTGIGADDPALLQALAPVLAGLVEAPRRREQLLRRLAVPRMSLADALEALPGTRPDDLVALYRALAASAADPVAREAMSGLPVPLAEGRTVHGARGLVLLTGDDGHDGPTSLGAEDAAVLAGYGLRLVHPTIATVAADLLERLGARRPTPAGLLDDPAVHAAVTASPDAEDPDELAAAVLAVVAAALPADEPHRTGRARELAAQLPWLGDLALPDSEDDLAPASALVLPHSLAAAALDADEVTEIHPDVLQEWGSAVLEAAGVRAELTVLRLPALDLADPDDLDRALDLGLADVADYAEEVWGDVLAAHPEDAVPTEVVAVRDLDLVRSSWPELLARLAASRDGLDALTAPWESGGRVRPGFTAWWLRRSGPLPPVSRAPGAGPDWLPTAPAWTLDLPDRLRTALGVQGRPDLVPPAAGDVLALLTGMTDALQDGRTVPGGDVLLLWAALAQHAPDLTVAEPPGRLPVLRPEGVRLVDAGDVVVADSPAWTQRGDLGVLVAVRPERAEALADLLDLDLTGDRAEGLVDLGRSSDDVVPVEVSVLLPQAPRRWTRTDRLRVDGQPVTWWVEGSGPEARVSATDPAGLAAGLAAAAGAWGSRHTVLTLLDPDPTLRAVALAAELPGVG